MSGIIIYYEYEPILGVNITYDVNSERTYDYFSSLHNFKAWAAMEFPTSKLIEVTDSNYKHLNEKGLI